MLVDSGVVEGRSLDENVDAWEKTVLVEREETI